MEYQKRFSPASIYRYIRFWQEDDIHEWGSEHEGQRKEVEKLVEYYSARLKKVNAELELYKKQAKLCKRHVKLRKMHVECNLEYYKTRLEFGPHYSIPDLGWVDDIHDELHEIDKELLEMEKKLPGMYEYL